MSNHELALRVLREAAHMYDATRGSGNDDAEGNDLQTLAARLTKQDDFAKELPADMLRECSAVRPPTDRVTCLLVGNHSAGKSSFVNWYVGEHIQSTSVAMETAGFTVVRKGKKRVEWRGKQTASSFPHLEHVVSLPGVVEHMETQFSTSTARDFPMVEFIDTPGLVDGTVKYPFDIDEAIERLAEHASIVLVFMDPIGKALVARTMKVVEKLSTRHLAKMHFVLAKFDTVANQNDRTNVISQVAQELSVRVSATHALKIHSIFIPDRAGEKAEAIPNQIGAVCGLLTAAVDERVQQVIETLLQDTSRLSRLARARRDLSVKWGTANRMAAAARTLLAAVGLMVVVLLLVALLLSVLNVDPLAICGSATGRTITRTAPDGSVETERQEPRKTLSCMALTFAAGGPAAAFLTASLAAVGYLWIVKTARRPQLSFAESRGMVAICKHLESTVMVRALALRKRVTADALDDGFG
ncbi:hypothetical protein T484DRAFT_2799097 [Baffinella frigidus]|nr:hypothetical protein T484DRAFT_2799097 [Cryptophyta sp. CCMP2293]